MVTPAQAAGSKRSAGALVLRRQADGWRCLLLRAYRNWDLPKGLLEPGEDALTAALREVREETGLDGLRFPWGHDFRETAPYAGGKVTRFYLAESAEGDVTLPINPALGRPEHHEYRWASFAEARARLAPRFGPILDWAQALVEG